MYDWASERSPAGLVTKGSCGRALPPASLNPDRPGGMKCVAIVPSTGPPRVRRSVFLLITAATARRTLTLSNGLTLVFSAMKRIEPAGLIVRRFLRGLRAA